MPKTQLTPIDVQHTLSRLGYYDGATNGNMMDSNFRDDLKRFQADYRLVPDGMYGPKTEAVLLPYAKKLDANHVTQNAMFRRWRGTYYYFGEQSRWKGTAPATIPVKTPDGKLIAKVEPRAFAEAALQGTSKLADGRLFNVATNPDYVPADPKVFQPVYDHAKRNGWIPDKPGYAGIRLNYDNDAVASARAFKVVTPEPSGFTKIGGIELSPYKTLATDIGSPRVGRSEPKFMNKGGLVPRGTKVFILEFVGTKYPDGQGNMLDHDGWFTANDSGGGIFGAHFDVFVGFYRLVQKTPVPERLHVWFEGIEKKIDMNYTYGL